MPAGLRVMVISTCPVPWGGSEELWACAAMRLLERGHAVSALRVDNDLRHPRPASLLRAGAALGSLLPRAGRRWPRAGLQLDQRALMLTRAAAELVRFRADVVLISQGLNYDGLLFAHLCRRLGRPYVLVSQKAAEHEWPPDAARLRHALAHRGAHASVFVSEHNRRITEWQIGAIPSALVMHNPVVAGREGPLPWPDEPVPRLACVARLHAPEKGQDLLLRALATDAWRARDVRVDLYGDGHNRAGLQALSQMLSLDHVRFAGVTPDVAGIWRTHELLVLPSRSEGLPLALVEAMMYGRPSVVTDVGGNAEVVEDGTSGFVASAATTDAIGAALERAWQARDRWETMGQTAARRIRELLPLEPRGEGAQLADLLEAAARSR